jgi:hypothetical protein
MKIIDIRQTELEKLKANLEKAVELMERLKFVNRDIQYRLQMSLEQGMEENES